MMSSSYTDELSMSRSENPRRCAEVEEAKMGAVFVRRLESCIRCVVFAVLFYPVSKHQEPIIWMNRGALG